VLTQADILDEFEAHLREVADPDLHIELKSGVTVVTWQRSPRHWEDAPRKAFLSFLDHGRSDLTRPIAEALVQNEGGTEIPTRRLKAGEAHLRTSAPNTTERDRAIIQSAISRFSE
jgi:hypothetical protein